MAQPPKVESSAAGKAAISQAIQSDMRAEDKARDAERHPLEVLSFFRLEPNMRVIEILPFGGWFTKIIGPVVREQGMLYTVQPDLGAYSDALEPTLKLPGMDKVVKLDWHGRTPEGRNPFVGSGEWDVEPVDLVVTFRNYHNFGYDDRMRINKSAFDALKSGGLYGIVDHTRRHIRREVSVWSTTRSVWWTRSRRRRPSSPARPSRPSQPRSVPSSWSTSSFTRVAVCAPMLSAVCAAA